MKPYNKRTWLNPPNSHYTGSIVCHDNSVINQGKPRERYTFVEISSCHVKLKLHPDANDFRLKTVKFIEKLRLIISELDQFADYLEENLGLEDE